MPWVRIDDGFARHPKVAAAGPLAMAMQIAALCYCNQELTDGFVPRSVARTLVDWEIVTSDGRLHRVNRSCGMVGQEVTCQWVIELLVDAGLWEEIDGGYQIHDFAVYQPTREQVLKEREQNAERQSRWRDRHRSNGVSNAVTNSHVTDAPYPVPVPNDSIEVDTSIESSRKPKSETRKRPNRLAENWQLSEIETAYAKSQGLSPSEIAEEADKFRDHWLSKGEARADWSATWRNWVRNSKTFNRPKSSNGKHIPARDNVMTGDGGWFDDSEDNPFRGNVVRAVPQ